MHEDSKGTEGRYCVIGAGPAGLCMAAEFNRRGVPYDHFEKASHVGGIWQIEDPDSPLYESAHFISSKTMSSFLGFPMPDSFPDYPKHSQILSYLEAFAEHHGVGPKIRFDTRVERVVPERGAARVTVDGREFRYRGVVCASGVNREPLLPDLPGHFDGELRHSKTYRRSDEFEGKQVVIVGLGNSGADIASDAARSAKQAWVSVRRGYHFIPKYIFGKPADVFSHEGPALPLWLEGPLFGFLQRLLVGDVRRFGMPRPDHALLESHPLLNDQLLHYLRHGDITIKPNIERLDGDGVLFADGTRVRADLVLCATGYRRNIPYLEEDALDGEWAGANFLTCISRKFDSLFTLGFVELNGALYPQLSRMSALIGQLAAWQLESNPEVERFYDWVRTTRFDLTGGRTIIDTPRHAAYCDERALVRALEKALKRVGQVGSPALQAAPEALRLKAASRHGS